MFERLGGKPAIDAVADDFVNHTTSDPRIKERFFNTDAANLKKLLSEFVCEATGGPCKYSGRDMAVAHAGMELVDDEFTALVENLKGTLDKFNVPAKEQSELLGALAGLKDKIVVPPGKLTAISDGELAKVTKLASTLASKPAADLLAVAVAAGKRGQRSYAEQLFTRAELITGVKPLASIASVFRAGAPPRVQTALKSMPKESAPQPKSGVGNSDEDAPDKKPAVAHLHGTLTSNGKPLTGLAVVTLTPVKGPTAKRTAKQRVIEQRDKTFAPHVMAVPVGSTVAFPNFDSIYHNVFSLSHANPFDLGLYKNGDLREVTFAKPGVVRLGCNIHASMSAYIVVVAAPHYVVVQPDGTFSFKSLTPGTYSVESWGEQSAEPTPGEIIIKAGDNETELNLKSGAPTGPSADKFGASRS